MMDMDGFKFLDQLRRRSDGANLPVVVLSGKPLSELELEYIGARAQGVQLAADGGHHIDVLDLVDAADVVGLAGDAVADDVP